MANDDLDPYGNYHFTLELDNVQVATFLEFSGLKTASEVFEIQEGGLNGTVHKRPSGSKYENFQLRYATNASTELAGWRDSYIKDEFGQRKNTNGAVVMRNNLGEEIRRYTFHQVWPVSWEGPTLSADGSALAVETLEIAYDGLYVDGGDPPEPPEPPEPQPQPNPQPLATEAIPFEYDSTEMKPEGPAALDRSAAAINAQDPPPETVWVEGHTCTMGSFAYNLSLSSRRAAATCEEMKSRSTSKFVPAGMSYAYPVTSNATEAGRAQNRRTEFYDSSPQSRGREAKDPGQKPG